MRFPSPSRLAPNSTTSEALKTLTTYLGYQSAVSSLVSPVLPNFKIHGRAQPDDSTANANDDVRQADVDTASWKDEIKYPVIERARPNFEAMNWTGIHADAERFFMAAYELSAGGL